MTKYYFPFDAGLGANSYQANWTKMARMWRPTGVMLGERNEFEVYGDGSGMNVKVKTGIAFVRGHYYESDAEETLTIATAHGTNPRIDRIVLRVDWVNDIITTVVVAGTAAAIPAAPALTQSATIWEMSLAQVWVKATVTSIAAVAVFDERIFDNDDRIGRGRLSLIKGNRLPAFEVLTFTPASTNTTNETVTFTTTPTWANGQAVQVSATVGGLTGGVTYYVYSTDGLTYSFHSSPVGGLDGTSDKINLTGNVTNPLYPAKLYLTGGVNSEISLSITALTANTNYDIFLYDNSGIPTLEALAWTSGTARATAIVAKSNRYYKSGDATRLLVGTIRTTAVAGQILDHVKMRYICNYFNREPRNMSVVDTTDNWACSASWAEWNASVANRCEIVQAIGDEELLINFADMVAVAGTIMLGIGIDSTSVNSAQISTGASGSYPIATACYRGRPAAGYHYVQLLEYNQGTGGNCYGDGGLSQLNGAEGYLMA